MTFFRIENTAVSLFRQVSAIIWEILKLLVQLLVSGLIQISRPVLFIGTVSLATMISIFHKTRWSFVRFLLLGPMLALSVVLWLLVFFVKLLSGSFVPPTFPSHDRGGFSRLVKLREFLSKFKFRPSFLAVTSDVIDFWVDSFGVDSFNPFFNKIVYG